MASTDVFALHRDLSVSGTQKLDIRKILPEAFIGRNSRVETVIDVACVNNGLQDYLVGTIDAGLDSKDDLAQLHDLGFLGYLHARFLGVQGLHEDTNEKHSTWAKMADIIEATSETALPKAPAGLSHTVNEHINQLATAHSNLWEGAIYRKSLEYVCRIVFRLHLAPLREEKYRERLAAYARKKQRPKGERPTTRKKWNWELKELCDELQTITSQGKSPVRTQVVLQKLCDLQAHEPERKTGGFLSLEEELARQTLTGQEPSSCGAIIAETDDDDQQASQTMDMVEEEIEEEEQEEEEEGEKEEGETVKESIRARLRSLEAVTKVLLESPCLDRPVDVAWVRETAFKGDEFTEKECAVVVQLVNFLRPFTPKRRLKSDDAPSGSRST